MKYNPKRPQSMFSDSKFMQRLKSGDEEAKEIFLDAYMGLIKKIAYQFIKSGCKESFEDLVQIGVIGLLKALDHYDPAKGNFFSTYAHVVVSRSIIREIGDGLLIKKSFYKEGKVEYWDITILSLEEFDHEFLPDDDILENQVVNNVLMSVLSNSLHILRPKEKTVFEMLYFREKPFSVREIAEKLGVRTQRVYQIREFAIERLIKYFHRGEIKPHIPYRL